MMFANFMISSSKFLVVERIVLFSYFTQCSRVFHTTKYIKHCTNLPNNVLNMAKLLQFVRINNQETGRVVSENLQERPAKIPVFFTRKLLHTLPYVSTNPYKLFPPILRLNKSTNFPQTKRKLNFSFSLRLHIGTFDEGTSPRYNSCSLVQLHHVIPFSMT